MNKKYTLAQLFEVFQNGISVPRIQRGYVQGRKDKKGTEIQKEFAPALVSAVFDGKELSLDFIYGVVVCDDGAGCSLHPLDGQQRLSTLFLLAWLCGKWEQGWNFTYESRRIPQLFVKGLLNHSCKATGKPSKEIEEAGWFLPIWKDDSSVAGMLRMLDTLHESIGERNRADADFGRITFLLHGIDGHDGTFDHIFRKMNARGKELSPWENMKAMLDKHVPEALEKNWRNSIDGVWAECIWKHANEEVVNLDNAMEKIVRMAYVQFVSCYKSNPDNRVHRYAVDAQNDSLWDMEKTLEANSEEGCKFFFQTTTDYFRSLTKQEGKFTLAQSWTGNRTHNALWGGSGDENEFWKWLFNGHPASAADLLRMAFLAEKMHDGIGDDPEDDQRRRRILLNLLDASSINKENFAKALDASLGFIIAGESDLEVDLGVIKSSEVEFSSGQIEDEIMKCRIDGNEIVVFEKDELVSKGSLRFIGWSTFENKDDIDTRLNVIRNRIKGNEWLDFYQNLVSRIPEERFNKHYVYTPLKEDDIGVWREKILTDGRFIDALKHWHNNPAPPEVLYPWMRHLADLLLDNRFEVRSRTLRCWDNRMFLLQTDSYRSPNNSIRLDINENERKNRNLLASGQIFYSASWPWWVKDKEDNVWYNVCDPSWWESETPPKWIQIRDSDGKIQFVASPLERQTDS